MEVQVLLGNHDWRLTGKWKEVMLLIDTIFPSVIDREIDSAFAFAPSAYINVNFKQYVVRNDYLDGVSRVKRLFETEPRKTFEKMKKVILESIAILDRFSMSELNQRTAREYIDAVRPKGRHWYDIMLADGALSVLYPQSLPGKFKLKNADYAPQSLLAKVALPKKVFPMIEEKEHLLEMAISLKKGGDIKDDLRAHIEKYSWMNSLCWWEEPFTNDYYLGEIRELAKGNPTQEYEKIEKDRGKRYDRAESLLDEVKDEYPRTWQYIDFIRELTDLKEENWDVVSLAGARTRPLFKELAADYYLSINQLLQMTGGELFGLLENGKMPVEVDALNKRLRSFAYVFSHSGNRLVTGEGVEPMVKMLREDAPELDVLIGMPVWEGLVKGRVRVINFVDDVSKMKKGEILICPMSDPDYMPAIKKAAAIVADQGGLLCHAAIVAREFQIPCVVGTDHATKVLKDGDLIEVDAHEGVVRKMGN